MIDNKPNVDALRGTLDYIVDNPEEWDQEQWVNVCGTAYCYAGHAVRMSEDWDIVSAKFDFKIEKWTMPEDGELGTEWLARNKRTGEMRAIGYAAREILQIDDDHVIGSRLFGADNTLPQLDALVEDIISGIAYEYEYRGRDEKGNLYV